MAKKNITKEGHRVHVFITKELFEDIEKWANTNGMTLSEFYRESFNYYLRCKRREIEQNELVKTCLILKKQNYRNLKQWQAVINRVGQDDAL